LGGFPTGQNIKGPGLKITLQQAAGNALAIAVQMKEHMMSSDTVVVQKKDKIGTLILNRAEIMNALNIELITALRAAIDQIATDEDIKVVVIKGAGRHFLPERT
jgi:1,4-dihydroxy-2-naphthoyl-CoA synthase